MASYFRQVPDFAYVSRNQDTKSISDYSVVKNFFKRGKLREDIFSNLAFFEKYTILGGERPDNVAFKFYDDDTLDWVILLSNNILNVQSEWPLPQNSFDQIMLEKYESYENLYSGIHHYETIEIKNTSGAKVLPAGLRMKNTWKTEGNFIQVINTRINQIFAGSAGIPTRTVTVTMNNGIKGLTVGSQIYINNVSEKSFNGRFTVTSINASVGDIAISFNYELPSVPSAANPVLSTSGQEEVIFTIDGDVGTGNAYYYEYYDSGLGYYMTLRASDILIPITNYEYESKIEAEKRNIFVLKPKYLNVVLDDITEIMTYKRGAAQYISNTLKKADNIRIYE
jgi:hypothetical protein